MTVKFSLLSSFKLQQLTEYLELTWGINSSRKLLEKLDATLKLICENPEMYPVSDFDSKLRKCVLTSQTNILYEIDKDVIFVLNIIDNRQNPKEIFNEIKKHFD